MKPDLAALKRAASRIEDAGEALERLIHSAEEEGTTDTGSFQSQLNSQIAAITVEMDNVTEQAAIAFDQPSRQVLAETLYQLLVTHASKEDVRQARLTEAKNRAADVLQKAGRIPRAKPAQSRLTAVGFPCEAPFQPRIIDGDRADEPQEKRRMFGAPQSPDGPEAA